MGLPGRQHLACSMLPFLPLASRWINRRLQVPSLASNLQCHRLLILTLTLNSSICPYPLPNNFLYPGLSNCRTLITEEIPTPSPLELRKCNLDEAARLSTTSFLIRNHHTPSTAHRRSRRDHSHLLHRHHTLPLPLHRLLRRRSFPRTCPTHTCRHRHCA